MDNLVEKISSSDYNADKYVRDLSHKWVGCHELRQQRKAVQALSENTNICLKKNVYENYTQFIETAKEINSLESEMYQLSHLLSEQKVLFDAIYNSNIHADIDAPVFTDKSNFERSEEQKIREEDELRRLKLTAILEKVEGCSGLLEVKGRTLIHEGDLIECDPVDNTPLHKVHAYLFNDALILALWIKNRRGPALYKMEKMYDMTSVAVVNVRDAKEVAFKILAFPDTKQFTCPSAKAQKEWMECFDLVKKQKVVTDKLKRENLTSQSSIDSVPTKPTERESHYYQTPVESPTASHWEDSYRIEQPELPEWFMDTPENLEVFIAERHFESALELIIKGQDFSRAFSTPNESVFLGIKAKLQVQKRNLTNALVKELEVSPEKSLQGGLRAARRAVRLLNALDKQTQACELMLQLCTSIMKKELKSVKREGSSSIYVERLGHQFYSTLIDVATEFMRVFESSHTCIAALVVWTHTQLAQFINHVVKQVFVPQASLSTVADCVSSLRSQNSQLSDCGMDLQYELEGILQKPISIVLRDAKDKALEALRLRAADDKWRPLNMNNKPGLTKLLLEFKDLGVDIPDVFIRGECWLELTANTVAFIRMIMSIVEDCCKLHSQHLHNHLEDIIYELFRCQLRFVDSALRSNVQDHQLETVYKNALFLIEHLLKCVEDSITAHMGPSTTKLATLLHEFGHLKVPGGKPKPAPRQASVPKYSSEEFI